VSARAHTGRRAVAPRRRVAPRRGGSRVNWERLGRVVLVFVLAGVLASYASPMLHFVHSLRDSRAGKERLAELRKQNSYLQARTEALRNPTVLIREARKQGMVKPGERSFVIHGLPR
jgi:cell division protein FtsB